MRSVTARTPIRERLEASWRTRQSLLCVGLDPDPDRLPAGITRDCDGIAGFCRAIVEATASFASAFKPQAAHFAAVGGEQNLADLIGYIHHRYPDVPVILDAKRGDIGSTAQRYAQEAFERYDADVVTVNPYLGEESVRPYLEWPGRGVAILCRTSNPDSAWLQCHGGPEPVYLRVAEAAARWNSSDNVWLVAGATYPHELAAIRARVGAMPLLVPGIGAQGGDLAAVLEAGLDPNGAGLLINASRSILYASSGPDYEVAAATAAASLCDEIRAMRSGMMADRRAALGIDPTPR
jgi:orotidine-5'-phosphate decarboxylase